MSDQARLDAIFAALSGRFPGRAIRELTASRGYTLAGNAPAIEFIDYSEQAIGGPKDPFAVKVWADGETFTLSDDDLPAPTLRPLSQAVRLARVIAGLDPAERFTAPADTDASREMLAF